MDSEVRRVLARMAKREDMVIEQAGPAIALLIQNYPDPCGLTDKVEAALKGSGTFSDDETSCIMAAFTSGMVWLCSANARAMAEEL